MSHKSVLTKCLPEKTSKPVLTKCLPDKTSKAVLTKCPSWQNVCWPSVSASHAARGVEKESPSRSSFVQQSRVACEAAPRGGTGKQSLIGKCERTETSAVANTSLPFQLFLKANTYMYYICWLPFFSLPKTNLYLFQQSRIAVYVILAVLWAILTLRAWWWWVI